jgi:hypothetical protein
MKQDSDPRTVEFFRPKFSQMIEWKLDGHGILLAQRGNSRDPVVAAAGSGGLAKGATLAARHLYTNLRSMNRAIMANAVTAAQTFANNSPWRV